RDSVKAAMSTRRSSGTCAWTSGSTSPREMTSMSGSPADIVTSVATVVAGPIVRAGAAAAGGVAGAGVTTRLTAAVGGEPGAPGGPAAGVIATWVFVPGAPAARARTSMLATPA